MIEVLRGIQNNLQNESQNALTITTIGSSCLSFHSWVIQLGYVTYCHSYFSLCFQKEKKKKRPIFQDQVLPPSTTWAWPNGYRATPSPVQGKLLESP